MFQEGKDREEKIDKFLDNLGWYFSDKAGQPIGFYSTIGRIEEEIKKFNQNTVEFINTLSQSQKSSERLTKALNKITLSGVVVASIGILVGFASLVFDIYKFFAVK